MPKSLQENLSLLHQRGSCSNLRGTEHSRYLSLLALKVAKPLVPLLLLSLFECLRSEWGACSCAPGSSTRTRTYLEALCDMSNHGDFGLVRILIQADAGGQACDLVLAETKPCNQSAKAGPRSQLNSVNGVVEPCVMAGPISLYGLPITYIASWQESWKTCAVQDCEISPWHFA